MTRIEYLVAHPYEVEKSDIPLLKKEVEKYPYFYTLRALLLYGLKKENHPSFEDYLNKTSIHSSNRVDLYHYLNSEKIERPAKTKIEEDLNVDSSPLKIEDTVEEVSSVVEELKQEIIEDSEPIVIKNKEKSEEVVENSIPKEIESNLTIEVEEEEQIEDVQEIEVVSDKQISETELDIENAIQQTSEIEIQELEQENEIEENIVIKTIEQEQTFIEKEKEKEVIINNVETDSTHSFSDWLKRFPSQQKDQKTLEEEQEIAEREIKYKLIDDFLEKNPKIIPMKKVDISPANTASNFARNTEEYSDLMTETLAQIYIEQKKYDKAIKAYKILILKYPEKNGLFANRIKEIENLKNSK